MDLKKKNPYGSSASDNHQNIKKKVSTLSFKEK